jgi:hypothetical protein
MKAQFFWLLGMVLTSTVSAVGQSKRGSIEGVWQATEVTHRGGPGGSMTLKPGPNLTIFSGTHYTRVDVQTDKPRPVLANPASATAEQLREVWGPLVAEAGTYELAESRITLRPTIAKNPAAMAPGVSIIYSYKLDGNSLTLTIERDQHGPVPDPFSVKLVRIE